MESNPKSQTRWRQSWKWWKNLLGTSSTQPPLVLSGAHSVVYTAVKYVILDTIMITLLCETINERADQLIKAFKAA